MGNASEIWISVWIRSSFLVRVHRCMPRRCKITRESSWCGAKKITNAFAVTTMCRGSHNSRHNRGWSHVAGIAWKFAFYRAIYWKIILKSRSRDTYARKRRSVNVAARFLRYCGKGINESAWFSFRYELTHPPDVFSPLSRFTLHRLTEDSVYRSIDFKSSQIEIIFQLALQSCSRLCRPL